MLQVPADRHALAPLEIRTGYTQAVRAIVRQCSKCGVVILDNFYRTHEGECPSIARFVDYCVLDI